MANHLGVVELVFWKYVASEIFTSLKEKLKEHYSENDIIFTEKESIHTVIEHVLSGNCDDYVILCKTILGKAIIDI